MNSVHRKKILFIIAPFWLFAAINDASNWFKITGEVKYWMSTLKKDGSENYKKHLRWYPNGYYSEEAKERLKQALLREEKEAFEKSKLEDSSTSYENFLSKYPKTKYRLEIETRIESSNVTEFFSERSKSILKSQPYIYMDDVNTITARSKQYEKKYGYKIVPVVGTLFYSKITAPCLVYLKKNKFTRVNIKGKSNQLSRKVKKTTKANLKRRHRMGKAGLERGAVLLIPRKYYNYDEEKFTKKMSRLIDSAAKELKHDEYSVKLLNFAKITRTPTTTVVEEFTKNAYKLNRAYDLYTRNNLFANDFAGDTDKWSYVTAFLFSSVVYKRDSYSFPLDKKIIIAGIIDAINNTVVKITIKDSLAVLNKFLNVKDKKHFKKNGKPIGLNKKGSYFQKVTYAMGYLYGYQMRINGSSINAMNSSNGLYDAISNKVSRYGIKVIQNKGMSLNEFINKNKIFG